MADIIMLYIKNTKDDELAKDQEKGLNMPDSQKKNDGYERFVQLGLI